MSTQLILYPQTYEGKYSSTFTASTEFIVDGINFISINSSTYYDHNASAGATSQLTLTNEALTYQHAQAGGIAANTWYRLRLVPTSNPAPTLPTQVSNNLIIYGVSPSSISGVYQRLSNLTVGAVYTLNIDITGNGLLNEQIDFLHYNGDTRQFIAHSDTSLYGFPPATSISETFTAQTANDIIVVLLTGTISTSVTINTISARQMVINPLGVYTELQDGQVICDLYQEEDIPLTLSIDDFKNVAEQVKSYSKDFNLPATKRNNQIFNNMFEVTRADDDLIFNPYIQTKCVLKQDGFILFEGYLRLIDIKDKEGEISYNVNLYSEVIAIADVLQDRTFSNLDFTELEHDYTITEIENSWNESPDPGITYLNSGTSGFRDANDTLKYPFINWNQQFYLINAAINLEGLSTAFRPCIQIKYLIDRIFEATDFTYTSSLFNTSAFKKLYMDFNWGEGNAPVDFGTSGESRYEYGDPDNYAPNGSYANVMFTNNVPGGFDWSPDAGFDTSTSVFTAIQDNTLYNIAGDIRLWFVSASTQSCTIEWVSSTDGVMEQQSFLGQVSPYVLTNYNFSLNTTLNAGDTLYCRFTATAASAVKQDNILNVAFSAWVYGIVSSSVITTGALIQTNRGELGQWDFLKGILTMFNLITTRDEDDPTNILIETYNDKFINNTNSGNTSDLTLASRSIQHDWTDKVDISEMELKPLTDLNKETIFKFVEDDDDYAFNVFKLANSGWLYGSEKINQETFTILEGIKEIIAEPFAATVVKPLVYGFNDFIVPAVYAKNGDESWGGFDNSPRILYNNGVKTLPNIYKVRSENGVAAKDLSTFLQFSHLSDIPSVSLTTTDFVFSSRQLAQNVGMPPADNLYNTYWSAYFNELYHADTRIMTLKVNLNAADIAMFKFYDKVMIKNRTFRVNKIEYKPNSLAKVKFILIP